MRRMAKSQSRAQPLTDIEQREFIISHIPGRIRAIQKIVSGGKMTYLELAGVMVLARSISGFLGISTRNGRLCQDHGYFPHDLGKSWEVKLKDINGGACLKLSELTNEEQTVLEAGINEANLAFAHLTFWSSPVHQDARGRATIDYSQQQILKIQRFARTVIELYTRHTAGLPRA